jgi:hypothetical protein
MNRDTWAAIAAAVAVVVVIILGFRVLGGPGRQRLVQSDHRTVRALAELAQQIKQSWDSSAPTDKNDKKVLPANLDKFSASAKQDPLTHKPFTYRSKSNGEYELCATFALDSREAQDPNPDEHWAHPKGDYCFPLDAAKPVPQAPYYYQSY